MTTGDKGKLTFPCQFIFKIIGYADEEFEGEALKILHQHFPQLGEAAITFNHSRNGKYLALSVVVHALSQEQLDSTYQALSNNPHILFVL